VLLSSQRPPEWPILSHIDCFCQYEIAGHAYRVKFNCITTNKGCSVIKIFLKLSSVFFDSLEVSMDGSFQVVKEGAVVHSEYIRLIMISMLIVTSVSQ